MTKVCHISTAHPPFDVRIFHKECVSLAKAGFDVSLVVTHDKEEIVKGVKIVPLPVSKGRFHRMFIKTNLAFYRALKTKAKIFHFHDPELIFVGIFLRILGKKVIYDMHELVYHQIKDKEWVGKLWFRNVIASIYLRFEKISVSFFNQIVLAEAGYMTYIKEKYSSRINKFTLARNYPMINLIEQTSALSIDKKGKSIIVYAGGLTKVRGIKEACESMLYIDSPVEFWLLGWWESEEFKNECLSISDKIKYIGLLKMEEVYGYYKSADIGLATLYPTENHMTSMPVKSFEYMACYLPMIISDFEYWKKEFKDVATFVNPYDPAEIAKKLNKMLQDPERNKALGIKGNSLVKEKYSWEEEAKTLVTLYKTILN
tara:strand:+ start:1348 stop:2463 length:1116 start_codon:yes stop_codon:yes gene_type:complete